MGILPTEVQPIIGIPMSEKVAIVSEARKLFGVRTARRLWFTLGLPHPDDHAPSSSPSSRQEDVREFVAECLETDPEAKISAGDAYRVLCSWLLERGRPSMSRVAFGKGMASILVPRRRSNGTFYPGLRIAASYDRSDADTVPRED